VAVPIEGKATSYELAVGVKINIDDLIYMISPMDSPLILGTDAQDTMVLGKAPVDQIEFSWLDEEILTPRVYIAAAATTGDTALTVTTNEGRRFATGDTARLMRAAGAQELVKVTAIATSTVTVTRGYQSTTAGTIASGDVLIGIGTALAEGSDPEAARHRDRDKRTNYTEIFGPYKIEMSATEQVVSKYGVNNEWAKQLFNRMREVYIRVDQAALYGVAFNDTSNKMRGTGGLYHFLTTNANSSATEFTLTNITSMQQDCYNAGDVPTVAIVNPNSLADLNDTENTSRLRVTYDDGRRGRRRVETLDTEYGSLTIIRDRWVHPHNAFLVKPGAITRRILRPMQYEVLAKTGDADKGMIVGEEGFEIKGQQHMGVFTKLTDYVAR
jgi:hypothetical protein